MKVVVTGGTGHLGANLVRKLIEKGDSIRIVVLARENTKAVDGLDVEYIKGDVRDKDSLVCAFRDAEIVYNLAGKISIAGPMAGLVHQTNVIGVQNIIHACRVNNVRRLVHTGSIHAFEQFPINETLDENRSWVGWHAPAYDRSKAQGIDTVLQAVNDEMEAVVVCPTGILGPHDYRESRMGMVIRKLSKGNMPAISEGGFDWVDARDVSEGIIKAQEKGESGQVYILSGHWATIRELARHVEEATGTRAPAITVPIWLTRLASPLSIAWANLARKEPLFTSEAVKALREGNRKISSALAVQQFGYKVRPLGETVRDTIGWYRKMGLI